MAEKFIRPRAILASLSRTARIFSMFGAGAIIYNITRDAAKRSKSKDRIILLMSICDFFFAFFGPVLGLLMIPVDSFPGALGNQTTCNVQGFIYIAGYGASSAYNASLAIVYLLIVRFEFPDERLKRVEPFLHVYPFLHGMFFIGAFPLQVFNMGEVTCQVIASPLGCLTNDSCVRGKTTITLNMTSYIAFVQLLVIVACMISLYRTVLGREISSDRFRFNAENRPPQRDLSNAMKSQGLWYSGSYLLWVLIRNGIETFVGDSPLWLKAIAAVTFHFIGFSNAMIYFRPRYLKLLSDHPDGSKLRICLYTIFGKEEGRRRTSMTNASFIKTFPIKLPSLLHRSFLPLSSRYREQVSKDSIGMTLSQRKNEYLRTMKQNKVSKVKAPARRKKKKVKILHTAVSEEFTQEHAPGTRPGIKWTTCGHGGGQTI